MHVCHAEQGFSPQHPTNQAGLLEPVIPGLGRKGEEEEMNFMIVLNHIVGSTYGLWETLSK